MSGGVQFDEDQGLSKGMPRARATTFMDVLVRWGLVKNVAQAQILLLVVSVVALIISFYLFRYAVGTTPTLGQDQLRPGEVVPAYVRQNNNI